MFKNWFNGKKKLELELQKAKNEATKLQIAETRSWVRLQQETQRNHILEAVGRTIGTGTGTGLIQDDIAGVIPSYISPIDLFFDGQSPLFPFGGFSPKLGTLAPFLNTDSLRLLRWYIRWVILKNPTALGALGALVSYGIQGGFDYQIVAKNNPGRNTSKYQEYLDALMEANKWPDMETELFTRAIRDGEYFVQPAYQEMDYPSIDIIEPEMVLTPNGTDEWSMGCENIPGYTDKIVRYWVCRDYNIKNGHAVDAEEIVHLKRNVDKSVKRGIPDFFGVYEQMERIQRLIVAGTQGEAARTALSYIEQYQMRTADDLQTLADSENDYNTYVPTGSPFARTLPTQQVVGGTVAKIPEGMEYKEGPQRDNQGTVEMVKVAMQSLASRWNMPSWMISSDAEGVNFASALVAESPFVRAISAAQQQQARAFKRILWRALEIAVDMGQLPSLDGLSLQINVPPVEVRNRLEETQRNETLYKNKVMSKVTWQHKEQLNPEEEDHNIAQDPDHVSEMDLAKSELEATNEAPSSSSSARLKQEQK